MLVAPECAISVRCLAVFEDRHLVSMRPLDPCRCGSRNSSRRWRPSRPRLPSTRSRGNDGASIDGSRLANKTKQATNVSDTVVCAWGSDSQRLRLLAAGVLTDRETETADHLTANLELERGLHCGRGLHGPRGGPTYAEQANTKSNSVSQQALSRDRSMRGMRWVGPIARVCVWWGRTSNRRVISRAAAVACARYAVLQAARVRLVGEGQEILALLIGEPACNKNRARL